MEASTNAKQILWELAISTKMAQMQAAEGNDPEGAEAKEAEAQVLLSGLGLVSDQHPGDLALEISRRAEGRLRALQTGADPALTEEEFALTAPFDISLVLDSRATEVLRVLVESANGINESIPDDCTYLACAFTLRTLSPLLSIPKSAIRPALEVLENFNLVGHSTHYGASTWFPAPLGFLALDIPRTEKISPPWSLEFEVGSLLRRAAYARLVSKGQQRARADTLVTVIAILTGREDASIETDVNSILAEMKRKERLRARERRLRHERNTITDLSQLSAKEVSTLKELVVDHNRAISKDAGPGWRVRPTITTTYLVERLNGQISKTALKKALTRLHECELIRYNLDGVMGCGYWEVQKKAFELIGIPQVAYQPSGAAM